MTNIFYLFHILKLYIFLFFQGAFTMIVEAWHENNESKRIGGKCKHFYANIIKAIYYLYWAIKMNYHDNEKNVTILT